MNDLFLKKNADSHKKNESTQRLKNNNLKSNIYFSVKSDHNIEEYSFSQTTLEQVFIRFAKDQEIEDEEVSSKL